MKYCWCLHQVLYATIICTFDTKWDQKWRRMTCETD